MRRLKSEWVIFIIFSALLIIVIGSIRGNADERVDSAYIDAPGRLVVDYYVPKYGVVQEVHTVVLSVKEPHFCDIPGDPKRKWFFFEALLVEKEPIEKKAQVCTDFARGKCGGK